MHEMVIEYDRIENKQRWVTLGKILTERVVCYGQDRGRDISRRGR